VLFRSRRHQGSRRARGRLPGECGELAHAAAGSPASGAAGPGAGGRRRRAGILGGRAGRVARDGRATLLGASDRQRVGQAPPESATAGQAGPARDHVRAVGGGAPGREGALQGGRPGPAEQRCWVHRIANVLDKLPRSLQPRAKQALHEIMYAETRAAAEREIARFTAAYQAKYPKAVTSLTVDQDRLLAYFDYPAEHWKHLRTTNPIESTFATVRLREGVTKGAGSRTPGLVMAFKLLQVAEGHWRCLDAAELVPLVRAGVCFEDGVQIESQKKRKKAAA